MAGMLEWSAWEAETMNHMLRALTDEADGRQEQVGRVSREVEILGRSPRGHQMPKPLKEMRTSLAGPQKAGHAEEGAQLEDGSYENQGCLLCERCCPESGQSGYRLGEDMCKAHT